MGDVGSAGQRKLMQAKALIVGAGGLGSPSAIYLALAGVGTVGIVDFDVWRFPTSSGKSCTTPTTSAVPKLQSAIDNIHAYNPDVTVVPHEVRLESDNALEIINQYDLVINGADNFATRYLVNDACYLLNKPLVDGSILISTGRPPSFCRARAAIAACSPSPPPPGMVPNCAEAGVLGALTGLVGSIQATEALKHFLGIGESLTSRLLLIDALSMSFREVKLKRNPGLPPVRRQSHGNPVDRLRNLLRSGRPGTGGNGGPLTAAGPAAGRPRPIIPDWQAATPERNYAYSAGLQRHPVHPSAIPRSLSCKTSVPGPA